MEPPTSEDPRAALLDAATPRESGPAGESPMEFEAKLRAVRVLIEAGRYQEAIEPARALVREAEQAFGSKDARVARAEYELGEAIYDAQSPEAALPTHQRALALREGLLPVDDLELANSLNVVGNCLMSAARFEEAAPFHQRALAIRRKQAPGSALVAQMLNNIGMWHLQQSQLAEARPLFEEAAKLWEAEYGPVHEKIAVALNNLGGIHVELRQFEEAEGLYRRSLEIKQRTLAPGHPGTARTLANLAAVLDELGRAEEARGLFEQSLKIIEERLGPDSPRLEAELASMASRFVGEATAEEELLLRRVLAARERREGPEDPGLIDRLFPLGSLLAATERMEEARAVFARIRALAEKSGSRRSRGRALAAEGDAAIAQFSGDLAGAEEFLRQAVEESEAQREPPLPPEAMASVLSHYAAVCLFNERHPKAQSLYLRAYQLVADDPDADEAMVGHFCLQLARMAEIVGQPARVVPWLRQALARLADARPPTPPEELQAVLAELDQRSGRLPSFSRRLKRLVTDDAAPAEAWLDAIEGSLADRRPADAARLVPHAQAAADRAGPEFSARLRDLEAQLKAVWPPSG